jgi:hypothetical protein
MYAWKFYVNHLVVTSNVNNDKMITITASDRTWSLQSGFKYAISFFVFRDTQWIVYNYSTQHVCQTIDSQKCWMNKWNHIAGGW